MLDCSKDVFESNMIFFFEQMTTLTSPDGPSEVINARRTESLDAPAILKLIQPATEQLFGRINVVDLM